MSDFLKNYTLEFEKPIRDLENQISELREVSDKSSSVDISKEIQALQKKVSSLLQEIYSNLSAWDRVQLSRHPNRPHACDYLQMMVDDFHELKGDRRFANDPAVVTGFGYVDGKRVALVGIEKGRKTKERVHRNFGMPRPEGYRKALRLMEVAARFSLPVVTLIDTPGAYPGIGAEERGQAAAIAENLEKMAELQTPIISSVIGEGGSGGALGLGIGDRILMMEYSIYSVISPESCASILWADPQKAETAANALKLIPKKAKELEVIERIVEEPAGGAHRDPKTASEYLKQALSEELDSLAKTSLDDLLDERYQKFRRMGNKTLYQAT